MKALFMLNAAVCAALNQEQEGGGSQEPVNLSQLAETAEAPETEEDRQARKARLDRAREQAAKAASDGTAMPPELLGLAAQEIKVCWEEFAGRDGVYDNLKKVSKKMANIAGHILNVAKACAAAAFTRLEGQPDADPIKLAGAMFRNAMAAAEQGLRGSLDLTDDEAEAKLDLFLSKSWAVYKSQAKSGFDAGLDPRDHESLYSVVKAVKASKEAKSTGTRTDDKPKDEGVQDATQGAQDAAQEAQAADSDDTGEPQENTQEPRQYSDSESEIIAQGNVKVQGALILLHKAVHAVDLDDGNNEERLVNILRAMTREIAKLSTRRDDGSQDEETDTDDEMTTELPELHASEG